MGLEVLGLEGLSVAGPRLVTPNQGWVLRCVDSKPTYPKKELRPRTREVRSSEGRIWAPGVSSRPRLFSGVLRVHL